MWGSWGVHSARGPGTHLHSLSQDGHLAQKSPQSYEADPFSRGLELGAFFTL